MITNIVRLIHLMNTKLFRNKLPVYTTCDVIGSFLGNILFWTLLVVYVQTSYFVASSLIQGVSHEEVLLSLGFLRFMMFFMGSGFALLLSLALFAKYGWPKIKAAICRPLPADICSPLPEPEPKAKPEPSQVLSRE